MSKSKNQVKQCRPRLDSCVSKKGFRAAANAVSFFPIAYKFFCVPLCSQDDIKRKAVSSHHYANDTAFQALIII
jgi:hypothetical protein